MSNDRLREFERMNSPHAPRGVQKEKRRSLQRRILSSGQTQSVIKEESCEEKESAKDLLLSGQAALEEAKDTRTINILKVLPPHVLGKVPESLIHLMEWPHPGRLGQKVRNQMGGVRQAWSGWKGKLVGSVVGLYRRVGSSISTFVYKSLESSAAKATQIREQMPSVEGLKTRLPGAKKFGQLMEQTLEKLSDAMDRKVRKKAVDALLEREVLFARKLNLDVQGEEFFQAFLSKADFPSLVNGNTDFIPSLMSQSRPDSIPELLAYKQLIPQRYPALVKSGLDLQLRTLGYLLTSRFALQKGKSMDRASVDFANLVVMSLEDPDQIKALIEDIRLKWKLFNEDVTSHLTQAALGSLGQGHIAKDTFQAVNVTVRGFLRLPPE